MKNVYILSLVLFLIIAISSLKVYSTDGASCCTQGNLPQRQSWRVQQIPETPPEDPPEENVITFTDIANYFGDEEIRYSDKDYLVNTIINQRLWGFKENMTQMYGSYNSQLQYQLADLVYSVTECLDNYGCNDINGNNVRIKQESTMYYITGNDLINLILKKMEYHGIPVDLSR